MGTKPTAEPQAPIDWPDLWGNPLACAFFERDTAAVAQGLLGSVLVSRVGGVAVAGRIVETEAYLGANDPGSHAATKGITARNAVMFGPPGHAYVYFTYGNHHMLNLVTEREGIAGAVLVRGLEPLLGVETMRRRRLGRTDRELCNGPGKLAAALGLDLSDNAGRLGTGNIAVFEGGLADGEGTVTSGRIGLSSGFELPLRFYVEGNMNVSKGRLGPVRAAPRRVTAKEEPGRDSETK